MTLPETSPLSRLFHPRSVAVVGASPRSDMSRRPLRYLRRLGFAGEVYAINPKYREVEGVACYPSLADLPGPVDLVLVMVPAARAVTTVQECGAVGASAAVVLSSGFAETGAAGEELQQRLRESARAAGVRVLGPNCQGVVYAPAHLYGTFTPALADSPARPSGLAYVGQSGALGGSFMSMAAAHGLGLTAWASTGNQADLTVTDIGEALLDDPAVRVLALYFEALPDGSTWRRLTGRAQDLGKHLVVLRSGRSPGGRRAVASHTGAMIRHDVAFELVSKDNGVFLAADFDELRTIGEALLTGRTWRTGRVAVVTTSGGAGALALDHLESLSLTGPELGEASRARLKTLIPAFGSTANPVDVTADILDRSGTFGEVCRVALADEGIDSLLVVLTSIGGQAAVDIAEAVADAARATQKVVCVGWLYSPERTQAARLVLRDAGVLCFDSLGEPVRLLARLQGVRDAVRRSAEPPLRPLALPHLPSGEGTLTEAAGAALLDAAGIDRPRGVLVHGAAEATRVAAGIGAEVVLKVQSAGILHKTETGGVRLAVPAAEVAQAYTDMMRTVSAAVPDAAIDGVLVQRMLPPGVELVVAVQGARDGYPPVVTVGIGGTTAELYADITSLTAPVSRQDALAALARLTGWPLLSGFRGRPPADVAAAASAIAAVSRLALRLGGRLQELEINPLIVHERGRGAAAADLLAVVK